MARIRTPNKANTNIISSSDHKNYPLSSLSSSAAVLRDMKHIKVIYTDQNSNAVTTYEKLRNPYASDNTVSSARIPYVIESGSCMTQLLAPRTSRDPPLCLSTTTWTHFTAHIPRHYYYLAMCKSSTTTLWNTTADQGSFAANFVKFCSEFGRDEGTPAFSEIGCKADWHCANTIDCVFHWNKTSYRFKFSWSESLKSIVKFSTNN